MQTSVMGCLKKKKKLSSISLAIVTFLEMGIIQLTPHINKIVRGLINAFLVVLFEYFS